MSSDQKQGRSLKRSKENHSLPNLTGSTCRSMPAREPKRHSTAQPGGIIEQQKQQSLTKLPPMKRRTSLQQIKQPTPHRTSTITIPNPNNRSTPMSLEFNMKSLKQRVEHLEEEMQRKEDLNEVQRMIIQRIEKELEHVNSLKEILKQKLQQVEADMEQMNSLTQENETLRQTMQQIETNMNKANKENEILTFRIQQIKEERNKAQEELRNQSITFDAKIKHLVQEKTKLLEKVEQETNDHIETNDYKTKLMKEKKELMKTLKSMNEEMEQDTQQIQEALSKERQLCEQLKEQCEYLQAENKILTKENARLHEYNKNIRIDKTRIIEERKTRERAFAKEIEKLKKKSTLNSSVHM